MIKFSICIPNFNYAEYLRLTIQSVLDQTYLPFEIIVADNASTDHSVSVVKSFNSDKIKLVENKFNIGFAPNLDKATEFASGDYMILLSSDDLMRPDALMEYAKIIESNKGLENPLIVMSACNVIDEKGAVKGHKNAMTGDVIVYLEKNSPYRKRLSPNLIEHYKGHEVLKAVLSGSFQPAGQFLTTCYAKSLYDKVEGYHAPLTVLPDAFFSHKLLFQNPDVIYINQYLFEYRVHNLNNLAAFKKMNNIKHWTDNYLISQSFSTQNLSKLNLKPDDLHHTFINSLIYACKTNFLNGYGSRIPRLLAIGYAAYPKILLRNVSFYILIITMPFSIFIGSTYNFYNSLKTKKI